MPVKTAKAVLFLLPRSFSYYERLYYVYSVYFISEPFADAVLQCFLIVSFCLGGIVEEVVSLFCSAVVPGLHFSAWSFTARYTKLLPWLDWRSCSKKGLGCCCTMLGIGKRRSCGRVNSGKASDIWQHLVRRLTKPLTSLLSNVDRGRFGLGQGGTAHQAAEFLTEAAIIQYNPAVWASGGGARWHPGAPQLWGREAADQCYNSAA